MRIDEKIEKNIQEFTGSPLFLYKKRQRSFLTHLNKIEIDNFCQLFNYKSGYLIKNKDYGKLSFGVSIKGSLKCKSKIMNESNCIISNTEWEFERRYLTITCTKNGIQYILHYTIFNKNIHLALQFVKKLIFSFL